MEKIIKIAIVFLLLFGISQGISLLAVEFGKSEMNPSQPLSPGDWIYEARMPISSPLGGEGHFTFIYKGIEENNILVEAVSDSVEGKSPHLIKKKIFKLPLDSNKQTSINIMGRGDTYLLSVVDSQNRISYKKTEPNNDVPIRMYPDMQTGVAAHSADFDPNAPLFGGGKNDSKQ